jgi:predicted small metal-binding protein
MDASGEQLKNQKRLHFNCSDVVARNCDWQVSGNSEREIMPLIEQHSQEKHGLKVDDETQNRVRNAILKRVA